MAVSRAWLLLWRPRFGLRRRAAGAHPEAADSLGIPVRRIQACGVLLSGALAGLGGAWLSLNAHYFVKNMSAGRGFIALALVICAGWSARRILPVALLFGFALALQFEMQSLGLDLPYQVVRMIPYAATLTVLALTASTLKRAPAALGRAFRR